MRALRLFCTTGLIAGAFVLGGCRDDNPYDETPDGTVDRVERIERTGVGFEDGKLEKRESVEERPIDK